MLKPGTKCPQHRACVSGFRIECVSAFCARLYFRIHITSRNYAELSKKAVRCSNATASKSIVGIGLSELSKLVQRCVQCLWRLLMNQKSSSEVPGIRIQIRSRGPHWALCFRHLKPE